MTQIAPTPPESGATTSNLRVLLLGASYGTKNMGVNALAAGTVASVFHSLPGATFAFLDYSREPGHYCVRSSAGDASLALHNLRFSKNLSLPNNVARLIVAAIFCRLLRRGRWVNRIKDAHPLLKELLGANVVTAISGGDSFSDIYGMSRLFYVGLPQLLAIAAGRPLILLPQTVGPFATRLGRLLARTILRRAARIYCRDRESLNEVSRLLGGAVENAHFAYDMGFALEPLRPRQNVLEPVEQARSSGVLIGLNVSGLLYAGGYTCRNEFGLSYDYKELIRRLIDMLLTIEDVRILLVPHVLGGPQTNESDITACDQVYHEYTKRGVDRLLRLPADLDHHEIKYVIGRCHFFAGSRMHACIAALSQCVPAVGLAYSRKFAGVFESIECRGLVVDLTTATPEEVIDRVRKMYEERGELETRLRTVIPKVKQSVLGLFEQFSGAVTDAQAR